MGFGHLFSWGFVLQALALVHFFRRRPEGYWFFVIMFLPTVGALIYFVVEVVPDFDLLRGMFQRRARRRRIDDLRRIVQENSAIGNIEELADLSFDEGQFAKARELYDKVLTSSQVTSVDPYYRRGLSALGLGDAAAAVRDLEHVVAAEPKYDIYRAAGVLAHAYALADQPEKAEAQFKAATDLSTLSETYYNYASFLVSQGRQSDANVWAQRILDKKPTMPGYLRRLERPWFRKAKALMKP